MHWTDYQNETIINLFNRGLSATQIAKKTGLYNRDAILGKIWRLRRDSEWKDKITRKPDMKKSHKTSRSRAWQPAQE